MNILGVHWKNGFLRGEGVHEKNNIEGGNCLKRGGGLGYFADLSEGGGGCGWYLHVYYDFPLGRTLPICFASFDNNWRYCLKEKSSVQACVCLWVNVVSNAVV